MSYQVMVIVVVALAIVLLLLKSKYYSADSKGERGEIEIRGILKKLPENEYITVNDVVLRSGKGVTQIDHVVVSVYGIFVIETKNYRGFITGSDRADSWYRHYNKKKYSFHSPIRQNYAHIKALQELLGIEENKFFPIVVFSKGADLHVESRTPVIHSIEILQTIKSNSVSVFTVKEMNDITDKIRKAAIESEEIMGQHNKVIQAREMENTAKVKAGICPRCGGNLMTRNGKYGEFIGCSNYPKCRYTVKN
jgi:hypothetical protein